MKRFLLPRSLRRFWQREQASATVEFVIAVPLVLSLLLSSVDFGVVMLRQVFLDRSVDMAVRLIRLGAINDYTVFRTAICDNTFLIADCASAISINMRPVDTTTWNGLNDPVACVNRAEEIAPAIVFNPGASTQELMMLRICVVADPFISLTGLVLGMPTDASGGYFHVSRATFVNEPV